MRSLLTVCSIVSVLVSAPVAVLAAQQTSAAVMYEARLTRLTEGTPQCGLAFWKVQSVEPHRLERIDTLEVITVAKKRFRLKSRYAGNLAEMELEMTERGKFASGFYKTSMPEKELPEVWTRAGGWMAGDSLQARQMWAFKNPSNPSEMCKTEIQMDGLKLRE